MTRWNVFLQPYLQEYESVLNIIALAAMPKKDEDVLCLLHAHVVNYLTEGRRLGNDAPYAVRRMLHQYPIEHHDPSAWRPHDIQTTLTAYAGVVTCFLAAVLRSIRGHVSGFKFPLSEQQQKYGHDLYTKLQAQQNNLRRSGQQKDDNLFQPLHTFIYSLIGVPAKGSDSDQWCCPLMCWLAVSSVQPEGRFIAVQHYTPVLAKWEYLMRTMHLHEAVLHSNEYEDHLYGATEYQCSMYLREGKVSPWNSVREHQIFASSLAKRQAAPPSITWAEDMSVVTCEGRQMEIARLRSGLAALYNSALKRMQHLCNHSNLVVDVPEDLTEDMTDNTPGMSWLRKNTPKSMPLLDILFQHPTFRLAEVDRAGNFHWDRVKMMALRRELGELNRELAVLCFILPAPSPRGTEFADTRLANAQIPRNMYKDFGTWFIHHRLKTSSLTDDMFSNILKRTTELHMGCGVSLHFWRHMSIAIMREFIPPNMSEGYVGDSVSNHSTSQARQTYSRETGHLPFLTTDAMLESRKFCSMWHDVLGWGNNAPPIPMRLRNYTASISHHSHPSQPAPAPAADTTQLTNIVTAVFSAGIQALKVELQESIRTYIAEGMAAVQRPVHVPTPVQPQPTHSVHQSTVQQQRPAQNPPALDRPVSPGLSYVDADAMDVGVDEEISQPFQPLPPHSIQPTQIIGTPLEQLPQLNQEQALLYLRQGLQNPSAVFKSQEQLELLSRSMARDCNLIAILPTGGGKSACYEIPSIVIPDRLSIVFVPYVPLIKDQMRRAEERGVKVAKWRSNLIIPPDLQILYVSWENVQAEALVQFIRNNYRRIHRIVIDECHTILTSSDFRPKLRAMDNVQEFGIPKLYLSATLAPHLETEFMKMSGLSPNSTLIIRAPTNRPELSYQVARTRTMEEAYLLSRRLVHQLHQQVFQPDSRGIIFCRSVADSKTISDELGCIIHNSRLTKEAREENQAKWMLGQAPGDQWIAATSSFVHGIDAPYVDAVIF
ncbi:hypothetical protein B0H21DRAFT_682125, partial [Amylocystis lapponica]